MPRPLREYRIPRGGEFGAPRANGTRVHHGADYHPLDNNDGEPIYGTGPGGVVTHIGYNGDPNLGLGHNVTIAYPGGRVTIDGHMRERTPLHVGSAVDANTVVGHVGHTGNAVNASPPGSHDHHQMTVNGRLVDPEDYYGTTVAGSGTPITEQDDDMPYPTVRNGDPADPSISMLTDEAMLVPFTSMAEYEAAIITGKVAPYYQFPDGLGYQLLAARTARIQAARATSGAIDIDALAKRLAPLLTSPVLAALKASHGLSSADVEKAVRSVFADAATN